MKVAFLSHSFESLGLEALSASLKRAGRETALFYDPALFDDMMVVNRILSRLLSERSALIGRLVKWAPDVVCINVLSDFYLWGLDMARRVKRAWPVPVVMGGMHATSVPDVVVQDPHVDYVVQGEGDEAIVDIVRRLEGGEAPSGVANVWLKSEDGIAGAPPRPLIRDLDSLPFADKSLYDGTFLRRLGVYTIMASRGCPYRCTYCNAGMLRDIYAGEKGSPWRSRSVDSVIEELKWADRRGRVGVVNFHDEIFGADIGWVREFAPRYRAEIGKPFLAVTHPAHCGEEYVRLLKEAGCIKIDLGVQSTDPYIRKNVLKRRETNEQIASAIELFMKHGVFLQVENIFNLPGQNEENTREMARFYNKHRPNGIKVFGLRIYPRTPMEKIALERGLITREYVERNARGEINSWEMPLRGGTISDRGLFRFQTLCAMMLFMPPGWVDTILDRRLERYFPYLRSGIVLSRIINGQNWEKDVMKRVFAARYMSHIAGFIKSAVVGAKYAPPRLFGYEKERKR